MSKDKFIIRQQSMISDKMLHLMNSRAGKSIYEMPNFKSKYICIFVEKIGVIHFWCKYVSDIKFGDEQPVFTYTKMSCIIRKPAFPYAKTKTQISYTVTVQLISSHIFTTSVVQSFYFLYPKFQASSRLLWL